MIKGDQVVNGLRQEGMLFFRENEVVGNTDRYCFRENDGVHQKRVEWPQATNVKVEIDTSVVVEHKVTNHVGTLDNVFIVVEGIQKPGVIFCNKLARAGVRPQHVLAGGRA